MNSIISISNLHKSFEGRKVLCGIDLKVSQGELLVILGGSGSGKSVLLKSIIGLRKPDKGQVKIENHNITAMSESSKYRLISNFGVLFQGNALFDSVPVWENVVFGILRNNEMSMQKAKELAIKALRAVNISEEVMHSYPSELSGGMQKRVALARAISKKPDILIFDEPTSGLDPIMTDIVDELILKLVNNLGATAIVVTHNVYSAMRIANKIAVIKDGKIIWHGSKDEISNTGNNYINKFVHRL
jgi:phospholipid/cholesterol/gamma-HCH transport system ATP-binding protein